MKLDNVTTELRNHERVRVTILAITPNWAMVRRSDYPHAAPFVVATKDLDFGPPTDTGRGKPSIA